MATCSPLHKTISESEARYQQDVAGDLHHQLAHLARIVAESCRERLEGLISAFAAAGPRAAESSAGTQSQRTLPLTRA